MRRWTLPALLVCVGAGYFLGVRTAEPRAARASRGADAHGIADRPPAPPPLAASIDGSARSPRTLLSDVGVIVPDPRSTTEDPGAEQGTLVVDFSGFDGPAYARVEATDFEGNPDYEEEGADEDRLASFDLYPGEVLVRWEDRGAMRRFATRARIEAGLVTRVLAADPRRSPLPDPPGVAVLRVAGAEGGGLPDVDVDLRGVVLGDRREISIRTDPDGRGRFRVRAGSYELQAGDKTEPVSLREGEQRVVELRHDAHGEVVIDPALEGIYALYARDGNDNAPFHDGIEDHQAVRFAFVPPGSYDLHYMFRPRLVPATPDTARPGTRVLASLEVRAGRAERRARHPEPGFLEIDVESGRAPPGERQMRVFSREGGPPPRT